MAHHGRLDDDGLFWDVQSGGFRVLVKWFPVVLGVWRRSAVADGLVGACLGPPSGRCDEPVWLPVEDLLTDL